MPKLTPKHLILLAAFGSLALLAGAFAFQALGYAPCKMCYWQRYPHAIAILAGGIALTLFPRTGAVLGATAAATTAAVGFFHAGVEQKWWDGPSSCSGNGSGLTGLTGDSLLSTDVIDKVVMCDEISWAMFGLSMPAWNAVLSSFLVIIWMTVLFKASRT